MQRDSIGQTLLVTTILCVVCSVLVSGSAVGLRGMQEANKRLDQQKNVLIAAGLFDQKTNSSAQIDQLFESIQKELIDLKTGQQVDPSVIDPQQYDQRTASRDPLLSQPIAAEQDPPGIRQREKYAFIYKVMADGEMCKVVLPIYGKGLWSTLYGFLAVDIDSTTIQGITFYEHAETPGLGGEIDNPRWKSLWSGKKIFDDAWEMKIEVVKGTASSDPDKAPYQVDGLSGATLTARGVSNLVRYWLGPDAFGPYLERMRGARG
jgi:Na+-transporting NADH:ubiquinone oxidoreductase subunit C